MPSIRTPSETSYQDETGYFVDFDGTHTTHEDDLGRGDPEDGPWDATPMNNDIDESVQGVDRIPGATNSEQQDRSRKITRSYWNWIRRVWGWLRRMVGAFVACAPRLVHHRESA